MRTKQSFYRPHSRHITPVGEESMTKQSHKRECDIHVILSQYQKTGMINHINSQSPQYNELPDQIDYQESLAILKHAEYAFSTLPAKIRDYFQNSPENFLAAINDPQHADYLREHGILKPLPAAPAAAQTAPAPAAPETPS